MLPLNQTSSSGSWDLGLPTLQSLWAGFSFSKKLSFGLWYSNQRSLVQWPDLPGEDAENSLAKMQNGKDVCSFYVSRWENCQGLWYPIWFLQSCDVASLQPLMGSKEDLGGNTKEGDSLLSTVLSFNPHWRKGRQCRVKSCHWDPYKVTPFKCDDWNAVSWHSPVQSWKVGCAGR